MKKKDLPPSPTKTQPTNMKRQGAIHKFLHQSSKGRWANKCHGVSWGEGGCYCLPEGQAEDWQL